MRREEAIARLKAAEPDIRARGVGLDEFMGVYELLQERLGAEVDYTTRGLHRRLRPAIELTGGAVSTLVYGGPVSEGVLG